MMADQRCRWIVRGSEELLPMNARAFVLLACGIWMLATTPPAQAQSVNAATGGMAVGGNVTNSNINIYNGVSPEQLAALVRQSGDLSDAQKKLIARLEADLDLNQRQIRAALDILGEKDVPPERLAAKLLEIAERFKALQTIAADQAGDDPRITALKAEAKNAVESGELERADSLLAEVATEQARALTEQARALDRLAVNAAETHVQRGDIALTRLRYAEAAGHFAAAAAVFPPDGVQAEKRIEYLEREADALYRQGDEFGDNPALVRAIERRKALLALRPRERDPLAWAVAQINLGGALWALGIRESGTARLQDAVAAYRASFTILTREHAPLDWATMQHNFGTALHRLGERETGTVRLEEAMAAFRAALTEWTREDMPLQWAMAQNNLGTTLQRLGERESGTARLEEAVVERTRERAPLDWAATQSNLGLALQTLAERESGTARLEQAVAAYQAALNEQTRERIPLQWAITQNNLGNALQRLGERESGSARLEQAVAAYEAALTERTRERVPLDWATTQHNRAGALQRLGERESGSARLDAAVAAYEAALMERKRERVPLEWAMSTGNQGVTLMWLAGRTGDARTARRAVSQIDVALATMRSAGHAPFAGYYAQELPKARALVEQLSKRSGPAKSRA